MARTLALLRRALSSHPARTWTQYQDLRGPVIAGGIAYLALLSVFSILFVGLTVVARVIGGQPALEQRLVQALVEQVPGLVDTGSGSGAGGLVAQDDLLALDPFSPTGVVALAVALLSGLGWIDALREGVRAMFAVPKDRLGPVASRVRDLVGLVTFGVAVLASVVLSVAVSSTATFALRLVGQEDGVAGGLLLRALGVGVVLLVDAGIFVVLLRVLADLAVPWRDLRQAALVGATAIGALKLFAGVLLGATGGRNPLFAALGVLAGVLVWMNLVSRVVLLTAAWAATDPAVAAAITAGESERVIGPAVGPAALAGTGRPRAAPTHGARAADRTTIAAGAVLGALAVAGVRVVSGAVSAVAGGLRRR